MVLLLALAVLLPVTARAQVEVAVNLVNPMTLSPQARTRAADALASAGVRIVRSQMVIDDNGVAFLRQLAQRGIHVIVVVQPRFSTDAPQRRSPPGLYPGMYDGPRLSSADVGLSARYFDDMMQRLDEAGVTLDAIEFGNEINWSAFNTDFDVPGHGRRLTYRDFFTDPYGRRIAASYLRYLDVLAALRDARDRSQLNRDTPLISAGMGDVPGTRFDIADPQDSLRFLRENGLDDLVDAYGIHFYPNQGTSQDAQDADLDRMLALCSGNGKPCWITEWGLSNPDLSCDAPDHDRAALVDRYMARFEDLSNEGRLAGVAYYAWNDDPDSGKPSPLTLYRCGRLMEAGRRLLNAP